MKFRKNVFWKMGEHIKEKNIQKFSKKNQFFISNLQFITKKIVSLHFVE